MNGFGRREEIAQEDERRSRARPRPACDHPPPSRSNARPVAAAFFPVAPSSSSPSVSARHARVRGPLEDPPEATPEKTASMIARAVAELDAAPSSALLGALDARNRRRRLLVVVGAGAPNSSPTFARPARSMVVLGLGSPTHSATSRVQLALALKIAAHLGMLTEEGGVAGRSSGARSGVDLYDPAFSPCDVASLNALHPGHVRVASETFADAVCGPDATERMEPTFFFMPHCEADLYDAVIRANWAEVREDGAASEDGAGAGEQHAESRTRAKPTVMAIFGTCFWRTRSRRRARGGRARAREGAAEARAGRRARWRGGGRGRVCVDVDPGARSGRSGRSTIPRAGRSRTSRGGRRRTRTRRRTVESII